MAETISPRHHKLIEYLDAHILPAREKLKEEFQSGQLWGDFAAIKSCFNVIDSKDLALSGKYKQDALVYGDNGITINLDYHTNERLANVMAATIQSSHKNSAPTVRQNIYSDMLTELTNQNGGYSEDISTGMALLKMLKREYEKAPEEKKPHILRQYSEMNTIVAREFNARGWGEGSERKYYDSKDFAKNSLVCTDFTSQSCISMHFAGEETYYVGGIETTKNSSFPIGHAFMVSKDNKFVYDPTANGDARAYSRLPVLNAGADISKGDTLIVLRPDGELACFSSGQMGGTEKEVDKAFREGKITRGEIVEKVHEYNEQLIKEGEVKYAEIIKNHKEKIAEYYAQPAKEKTEEQAFNKKAFAEKWEFKDKKFVCESKEENDVPLTGIKAKGYHFKDYSLVPANKEGTIFNVYVKGEKGCACQITMQEVNAIRSAKTYAEESGLGEKLREMAKAQLQASSSAASLPVICGSESGVLLS